ncbi:MAG: 50S ribosomal protein L29 [Nitrospinota bacterium]|nr:50S ribosomal protein L29 [Nitrospinota bacterium]
MKYSEIKELTEDELATKEKEIRMELFNLKFRKFSGQLDNTSRISILKKDLARILTYKNELSYTQDKTV